MATSYHTERQAGKAVIAGGLLLVLGIMLTIPSTDVQSGVLLVGVGTVVAGSVSLVTQTLGEDRVGSLLMYGFGLVYPALWTIELEHDGQFALLVLGATMLIAFFALASHLKFKTSYGLAFGFGAGAAVSTVILHLM